MMNNKVIFQEQLAAAWEAWSSAYASLSDEELQSPGTVGDWSMLDMIAHVSWSVIETNGMLTGQALVGSELWQLPEDQRNAAVNKMNKGRSVAQVLEEARSAHVKLAALVEVISETDLLHADWFAGLPGEWSPWRVIQVNVVDHYLHHAEALSAAIDQPGD